MTKSVTNLAAVIAAGAALSLSLLARADTTQIENVTITNADIAQLRNSLDTALKPNDDTIPIAVSQKNWVEMPRYDQRWHYEGMRDIGSFALGGDPHLPPGAKIMSVWFNKDLCLNKPDADNAIAAAFLLALTDGGYGGKAFKQLYDIYAARDAQLPSNSPDPFVNRHKFAAALVNMAQPDGDRYGAVRDIICYKPPAFGPLPPAVTPQPQTATR
ncbi:MAG: hypothetical protein WA431_07480 [Candidatus Cybelea sp.]